MLRQDSVSGHQLVDKWVVDTVTWSVCVTLRQDSVSGHQIVDKWVVDTVTWSVWSVCVLSAAVDRFTSFTSWLTAVFCLTCLSVGSSRFCKWLCWSPLFHSEHSCQQFSTSVCITFVQSWPRSVLTTASCVCMCVSEWVSEWVSCV